MLVGVLMMQVKKFKYCGVLFRMDGRMDTELSSRIDQVSAVMRKRGEEDPS